MQRNTPSFAIATHVSSPDDIVKAIALARSARLFSTAFLIVVTQVNDSGTISSLQDVFDDVIQVDIISTWNIFGLEQYEKILYLPPSSLIISQIDQIFLYNVPAAVFDGLVSGVIDLEDNPEMKVSVPKGPILIKPSRFAMDLLRIEASSLLQDVSWSSNPDMAMISLFYQRHGYRWNVMSPVYFTPEDQVQGRDSNVKIVNMLSVPRRGGRQLSQIQSIWLHIYNQTYQYPGRGQGTFAEMKIHRENLRRHLLIILEPILGSRTRDVLEKYISLYQQAFVTSDANPASNYELLEAYGDRFLAGQYTWLIIRTPGIISADQVTKISSHFQNRYSLEQVCDYLELTPYIIVGENETLSTDTKSDVIEALIAAIGISWQNMYKRGDEAMRVFVSKVWRSVFTIDPERYLLLYEDPKTRFKELTEQLQANRSLIRTTTRITPPQENGGEVIVTVLYGQYPVGVGRVSTQGMYRDTAVKLAERAAYLDALEKNSIQLLLNTQT